MCYSLNCGVNAVKLLGRKKKDNTAEIIQNAVRQELDRRESEYEAKSNKEKEKLRRKKLWDSLSFSKKMQLLHRIKRGER